MTLLETQDQFTACDPSDVTDTESGAMPTSVKLRVLANGMDTAIHEKSGDRQANTPKRIREAEQAEKEVREMKRIRAALLFLADAHDAGTVPPSVSRIKTKIIVQMILAASAYPDERFASERGRLASSGISNADDFGKAKVFLEEGAKAAGSESEEALKLKKLMRWLVGVSIPGYFPTPPGLVTRLLELAQIEAGMTICEPQAGSGHIADRIRYEHPEALLTVIEINLQLREILSAKGYELSGADFLEWRSEDRFDRFVMNPPFEKGADIDHVRHAFDLLAPGGRMVAVMSMGAFFRSDKKAVQFQDWFRANEGETFEVPHGAFLESDKKTAANTKIVVLNKPGKPALTLVTVGEETRIAVRSEDPSINIPDTTMARIVDGIQKYTSDEAVAVAGARETRHIALDAVVSSRFQPRIDFDEAALAELAISLKEDGQQQSIVVRPVDGGKFEIVMGERRVRAARLAGLTSIRAEIATEIDDVRHARLALIENVLREPLNPIERARGYSMLSELGRTQEEIAKDACVSQTTISQTIKLLELPDAVQDLLRSGGISATHGFKLLKLLKFQGTVASLIKFAQDTVAASWSVGKLDLVISDHIADLQRSESSPYFNIAAPAASAVFAEPGPSPAGNLADSASLAADLADPSAFGEQFHSEENVDALSSLAPNVLPSNASAPLATAPDAEADAADEDDGASQIADDAPGEIRPAPSNDAVDAPAASVPSPASQTGAREVLTGAPSVNHENVAISKESSNALWEMGLTADQAIAELAKYRLTVRAKTALKSLNLRINEAHPDASHTLSEQLEAILVYRAAHIEEFESAELSGRGDAPVLIAHLAPDAPMTMSDLREFSNPASLADDSEDKALLRACFTTSGAQERWLASIESGETDMGITLRLGYEFGNGGGSGGPGTNTMSYRGGANPAFWYGSTVGVGKPTLQGKALVAAVRRLFNIAMPEGGAR